MTAPMTTCGKDHFDLDTAELMDCTPATPCRSCLTVEVERLRVPEGHVLVDARELEALRAAAAGPDTFLFPDICEDDIDEMWRTCEDCPDPARAMAVEGYKLSWDHRPAGSAIRILGRDEVVVKKEFMDRLEAVTMKLVEQNDPAKIAERVAGYAKDHAA